jgi:hypothetical protein
MIVEVAKHGTELLQRMLLQKDMHEVAGVNTLISKAIWHIFN